LKSVRITAGLLLSVVLPAHAEPILIVDAATPQGVIRPLHGVNGSSIVAGGTLDLSAEWRAFAPPLARLHDCHWPNADVVDLHVVFPNPVADPSLPESYDFARTDELIKALIDAKVGIVFRLGENIEHNKIRKHVHPPKDPARWAAACVGIVRHYNEGWANGFHHDIRYWEVWNEPDNRPAMWSGTDEDYLRLYDATAKALKDRFPKLKVGGPGLGNSGRLVGDKLEPSPLFAKFVKHCRDEHVPLDFFSWHCYTSEPRELVRRAHGVRARLDDAGFSKVESHLNEWNYLPDNDWKGMLAKDAQSRQLWHERIGGTEGAAFIAASLIQLQSAPVDAANYFTAEPGGMGLFNPFGVPRKSFFAMKAVGSLASLRRLPVRGASDDTAILAGINAEATEVRVLMSRQTGAKKVTLAVEKLPWKGASQFELSTIDDERNLEVQGRGEFLGQLEVDLPGPVVSLLRVRPSRDK
jgi:xylan 1,4-beta-xylosidase